MLADILEKFRNNALNNYDLCPSHYVSSLALCKDAMLNMIKVEFELISDADTCLFFEKGMRGGASYVSKRYSKANNKYLEYFNSK